MPSPYSPAFLASIERTVTRERLKRYLQATGQDLPRALELYEYNVALSAALYGLLHWLEVAIRNAANHSLTAGYNTAAWYDLVPLIPHWRMEVNKAKLKGGALPGKVVADLTFGFWVELTGKSNNNVVWFGHGLRHAFPNASIKRDRIHDRLKVVQRLRNRISHHERVLTSTNTLNAGFKFITPAELVECVEWTCIETALWMKAQHRYAEAVRILLEVNRMSIVL